MSAFIPPDFSIPSGISTPEFRLRMLTVHDLVKDFDAVITSVDRLRGIFGPDNRWPEGLTLEQDLIDLGWHQKEFQLRRSFAYTVMSLDEAQCLGCVYVEPSEKTACDARVILWVRQSEADSGLDATLYASVKQWLADAWPFSAVAFPGREVSWADWQALPHR